MQNVRTQVEVRSGRLLEELRINPPDHVSLGLESDVGPLAIGADRRVTVTSPGPIAGDRAGSDADAADRTPAGRGARAGADTLPVQPASDLLAIDDGETTLFEAAVGAYQAGEFERAESLFLEEAEGALEVAPQRAAIAFRQAALAARQAGNTDGSDHWMRLAGREYLKVSEDPRTPLPYIREAALMAAKCFLSVENLHVASKGLRRAQAIESVLGVDDDLMAPAPGIPFRHGDTAPIPVVRAASSPVDRRSPDSVGASLRSEGSAVGLPPTEARRAKWLSRIRPRHAGRGAA